MLDYLKIGLEDAIDKKASSAYCAIQMAISRIEQLEAVADMVLQMATIETDKELLKMAEKAMVKSQQKGD